MASDLLILMANFHIQLKWLTPIFPQFKFIVEYYAVHFNKNIWNIYIQMKENFVKDLL